MSNFVCPKCQQGSLLIEAVLEISPDAKWDELTLQALHCTNCRFEGAAIYQESRRGALDSEIWQHTGYALEPGSNLLTRLRDCPNPREHRCGCVVHSELGERDDRGYWKRPASLSHSTAFQLDRAE
jgi:hypothetical protein